MFLPRTIPINPAGRSLSPADLSATQMSANPIVTLVAPTSSSISSRYRVSVPDGVLTAKEVGEAQYPVNAPVASALSMPGPEPVGIVARMTALHAVREALSAQTRARGVIVPSNGP